MKRYLRIWTCFFMVSYLFIMASQTVFAQQDEFEEFEKASSTQEISDSTEDAESGDEFKSMGEASGDEFSVIEDEEDLMSAAESKEEISYTRLSWAIGILLYTILAAIFMKYPTTRKLRILFLVIALVFLGFYRGGPGVISSFQNTWLAITGAELNWQAMVLFLGLLPITYFAGRVFCGWVCFLGAIQEFLYNDKIKILQSDKAQYVMRIIRGVALVVLIIQLVITPRLLWQEIGPFRVAVNLFSANITGYILLGIILVSSVFIYRPFCKMLCPVGLLLGLIAKIPGASVLGINSSCSGCKICNDSCRINAITRENKTSMLDNQECIRCGDCMDDCRKNSISFYNKNQNHHDKITLQNNANNN